MQMPSDRRRRPNGEVITDVSSRPVANNAQVHPRQKRSHMISLDVSLLTLALHGLTVCHHPGTHSPPPAYPLAVHDQRVASATFLPVCVLN